ncbi:MAG TPA: hypothetical protein VFG76_10865, partial [Candidatus Polarisedimenticolia bacterium]|nr:hypothetical protein [Candidatus Polarisedimenticolia bacterium]
MRSSPSPNQRFAGAVACAMALGVILYINTLHGPFMGDDAVEIQQNPGVHRLSGIPHQLVSGFTGAGTGGNYLYRPLTSIMSTVLWVLGGGRPEAFHLWNILIHSLCAGLVVVLLARLGAEAPAALIAGAFFAAHPIHTEAVARLSGHAETMACALVLIAWIAHLRARWLLAAGAFGVGLLAKESAIVFPALA